MDLTKIKPMLPSLMGLMMMLITTLSFATPLKVGVGISGSPIVEKVQTNQGSYYFGFCIDLMNNICKRIGATCTYHDITLENQFELLNKGTIDLLILSTPYQSFDLKQYAMSLPYSVSRIQFITLENSSINKISDIKNKKIGVIKDTFYELMVRSLYDKDNQIIAYNSEADLLSDLAKNKIDVIVLNNAIAYRLVNNNMYNIKFVGKNEELGDGYGIIALPDKAPLIEKIDKAILNIQNDGTYVSIYKKYYEDFNPD